MNQAEGRPRACRAWRSLDVDRRQRQLGLPLRQTAVRRPCQSGDRQAYDCECGAEASVPRRSIEAVQAACRDRGHEIAIGGQLFSDSMGATGTAEGTYVGMVRHNVNTLVEALR